MEGKYHQQVSCCTESRVYDKRPSKTNPPADLEHDHLNRSEFVAG